MKVSSWQQLELRRLVATAAAAQLVEDVVRALILRRDEGGNQHAIRGGTCAHPAT